MHERIIALQEAFDQAELHADTARLEQLLGDDFLSIGPKGFVLTKREWIDRHTQFTYQALDTSERDVRLYDTTAIVRNIQRNRATYNDQQMDLTVRVGQVWVEQPDGAWRLVAIQFSPMDHGEPAATA